jgi:ribosomal protein S18 acetylase RimI-like enzyme
MNMPIDRITANIQNLTSFWQTASLPFQSYYKGSEYTYCEVTDSDWPNRLWLTTDIANQDMVNKVLEKLRASSVKLTLPYFDRYQSQAYQLLESNGFIQVSEQTGMSLKLDNPFEQQTDLLIQQVTTETEAKLWADIFKRCFGYTISPEILNRRWQEIRFYAAFHQHQPVGTVALFPTQKNAGIHCVGILPDMRRKGFAEEIMKFTLNTAIALHLDYATLQSSPMGKSLYLKLGFEEQFRIKNYVLQKAN